MQALRGLAILLLLQAAGEGLVRALSLPYPGPVLGMLLLLAVLNLPAARAPVAAVAGVLLSHLSLLFVPVSVGVIVHLGVVAEYGGRLAVVIAVSTWCSMAATAWVTQALMRRMNPPGDPSAPGGPARIPEGDLS
jgi:holin-like protein